MDEKEKDLARNRKLLQHLEQDVSALKQTINNIEEDIKKCDRKKSSKRPPEPKSQTKHRENIFSDAEDFNFLDNLLIDEHNEERGDYFRPKNYLQEQYETLKDRMTLQADEIKIYRDRVLRLQDQLIQKNDNEKRFLKKTPPGRSPLKNDLEKQLEDRIAKVRSLEEAYRKQEKVIEKMDVLLRRQNISKVKKLESRLTELENENVKLKQEIDCLKKSDNSTQNTNPHQQQQRQHRQLNKNDHRGDHHDDAYTPFNKTCNDKKIDKTDDSESSPTNNRKKDYDGDDGNEDRKLNIWKKYEEAEIKIKELEKQLSEVARTWNNEKSELMAKLRKAENSIYE